MVEYVDARELVYFPDRYQDGRIETEGEITFDGVEYWDNSFHARTYTLEPEEKMAADEELTLIEPESDSSPIAEAFLEGGIEEEIHATVQGEIKSYKDLRDGGYGGKYKKPKKTLVLDVETIDLDNEIVYGI
ncbi:MAG: hypothetical protein SVU32_08815 [Candidatus Nanohaloarchaea archaeon]|nr:hypothetical protein [Candidatus Nanohaloarchaea archaeon]